MNSGEVISLDDYVRSQAVSAPPAPTGGHFDLVGLAAYARGDVEDAEGEAILEHCRACASCGDQLAMILLLVEVKELRAARTRRTVAAVAATAAFALFLVGATWSGALRLPSEMSAVAEDTLGASSGAPGDAAAAAPNDAVTGSSDVLMAAVAGEIRNLATTEAPNRVDLDFIYPPDMDARFTAGRYKRPELTLIVDGSYAVAMERLEGLYGADSSDSEAAALLGMALYLSGDDGERAERMLRQGASVRRQDLRGYSVWYLANLYVRRGDVAGATRTLQELTSWPDVAGSRARALLERLEAEAR